MGKREPNLDQEFARDPDMQHAGRRSDGHSAPVDAPEPKIEGSGDKRAALNRDAKSARQPGDLEQSMREAADDD